LNLLLAWFISTRYLPFIDIGGTYQGAYVLLVYLGHISLLVWLASIPVYLLSVIFRGWPLVIPAMVWGTSLQLLLLLDTFVYAQYRFHLSGFILDLLINAGTDVFSFSWLMWALAIAGVIVMLAAQWVALHLLRKKPFPKGTARTVFSVSFVALLGVHGWHAWAEANYDPRVTSVTRHIPVYHPATA